MGVDTYPELLKQSSEFPIYYDSDDEVNKFSKENRWCMDELRPPIVELVASGELPYKIPRSRKTI